MVFCSPRGGIIPALAGNTLVAAGHAGPTGDHPRACGEHVGEAVECVGDEGSPPRLRGTRIGCRWDEIGSGIIPALAGNTFVRRARVTADWDHPRACGEHLSSSATCACAAGSSPRLRGTRRAGRHGHGRRGIIPALAGNTQFRVVIKDKYGDHPRACGEHLSSAGEVNTGVGSSPRLRGTRAPELSRFPFAGIIPALAGNTGFVGWVLCAVWDHPRACGEHQRLVARGSAHLGSSPRLRGTRAGRLL